MQEKIVLPLFLNVFFLLCPQSDKEYKGGVVFVVQNVDNQSTVSFETKNGLPSKKLLFPISVTC